MKSQKKLSLILMIISALTMSFFDNLLGLILGIISFIISIKNLKNNELLNTIALMGSIIIIVFFAVSLVISVDTVDNTFKNVKEQVGETNKKYIEDNCEIYVTDMINNGDLVNGENIVSEETLNKYKITYPKDCNGYIIANIDISNNSNNTFNAYLKCKNYTTKGFNEDYLK